MPQTAIMFTSVRGPIGQVIATASQQGITFATQHVGGTWFVDTVNGSDTSGNGSPYLPFATMGKALESVRSNDQIFFTGKVKEQLVAPLGITGVSITGVALGGVRDDDGAKWTYPDTGAVAGQALLRCRNQGWSVNNFLMTPEPTSGACIELRRAEDDVNPDASHFIARGMRFVGIDVTTTYGIRDIGGCSNVLIEDCEFYLCTTGIWCSSTAIAVPLRYKINGNRFIQNTNDIILPASVAVLRGNVHTDSATTAKINLSGGGGTAATANVVTGNVLPNAAADIDPAHGYTGSAADIWTQNFATDQAVFGLPA
jgi:hypothetical protein